MYTYLDVLFDSVFVECILQDLVVFDEFVVELGAPLDLRDVEGAGVDRVHDLAVDGPGGALLDFGELQL